MNTNRETAAADRRRADYIRAVFLVSAYAKPASPMVAASLRVPE